MYKRQGADRRYYEPSQHGLEARIAERAERIRAILDEAENKIENKTGNKTEKEQA